MQGSSNSNNSTRWTADDKIRIVIESLTTNITLAEPCRKYNLKPNIFYRWKQKFTEAGRVALTAAGSSGENNINKQLQAENERLKRLIGELTIANDAFKKTLESGGVRSKEE
ncbi:MAG: transposase [Candidatus Nitrosocosmicus sp.]|nr:transposase [Candidatus Nitrosocosmicus sp.]MDN5868022.1 transposase [Candidatus Nitrosocosmicus sp.]